MSLDMLKSVSQKFAELIAKEEYELFIQNCSQSRLSVDDLRKVIQDYGKKFICPPRDAYEKLDVIKINKTSVPAWSVRVPLWSYEEGRSDLTIELTVFIESNYNLIVNLEDVEVL